MTMNKYICRLAQHWEDFRLPELDSVCRVQGVKISYDVKDYQTETPFLPVQVASDAECQLILDRAILVKDFMELWAEGDCLDEIHRQVKEVLLPEGRFQPHITSSFKFLVKGYGKRVSAEEQLDIINSFSYTGLDGQIRMKDPEIVFAIFFDSLAKKYYFGRYVGKGKRAKVMDVFNLKKREYLGTTSMDAELSLVMTNMGLVKRGSLVYDPFVGTGSFLYTSAFFGGYALGSDIDGRQMRGKGTSSIQTNIEQYGLGPRVLGGFVFDIAHNPWTSRFTIDAIVCDPPYGVRAGAKKLGCAVPGTAKRIPDEFKPITYPATQPYPIDELTRDLYDFAHRHLPVGGRLVFWYPVEADDVETFRIETVTTDTRFATVATSVHRCKGFDRWLVTVEKL